MGLLDRAKQQAQGLKGKVEEKVEDVQGKRKAGDQLEAIGRVVYAERTGRAQANGDSELDRLVSELRALEDGGVTVLPGSGPPAPH
jgi:hypothetical protein